jgi:hypothetical protein
MEKHCTRPSARSQTPSDPHFMLASLAWKAFGPKNGALDDAGVAKESSTHDEVVGTLEFEKEGFHAFAACETVGCRQVPRS